MFYDELDFLNNEYLSDDQAKDLYVKDLKEGTEYYSAIKDKNKIVVDKYDFHIMKDNSNIVVYIDESVSPKYFSHEIINAKVYVETIIEAAKKLNKVVTSYLDTEEPTVYSCNFAISFHEDNSTSLIDVFNKVKNEIDKIRKEADILARRRMMVYINKPYVEL